MTSDLPPTGGQQPPSTSSAPQNRYTVNDFFDRIRSLGVFRPDEGRWGAGVAAGLARRDSESPVDHGFG